MANSSNRPLLPDNIKNLNPYVAGKTIAEVQAAYQPDEISKLASNENRLGCSPAVKPAVQEAFNEIQDYPDPASRDLRAALAKRNNVSMEKVMVAAGSESIISILCRTFFRDGEEAITADATFVGFFVQANVQNIAINKIPVTADFRFDVQAMAEAVNQQTKMIYIANPNNPTGTYINKQEFEFLMDSLPNDVLVIMDEAYYEFADSIEDYPHASEYEYENVITLRTFSKAYGLAGFRVGYAIGPAELISHMLKTKLTFEPTTLGQAAALAALGDEDFLERSKDIVKKGRERLYSFFEEQDVDYIRSASNSVLMICEDEAEAKRFTQSMLEKGVILRRVNAFGLPHCVRITIGTEREMNHFERSFKALSSTN